MRYLFCLFFSNTLLIISFSLRLMSGAQSRWVQLCNLTKKPNSNAK